MQHVGVRDWDFAMELITGHTIAVIKTLTRSATTMDNPLIPPMDANCRRRWDMVQCTFHQPPTGTVRFTTTLTDQPHLKLPSDSGSLLAGRIRILASVNVQFLTI